MFWLFLLQYRHLAEIFIFIKVISHVHFIILVHQTVILSLLILTKLRIDKTHPLNRLRFERSELKKSQCGGENMLCTEIVLNVRNNFCTQHVLLVFCKKKRTSYKDLPVSYIKIHRIYFYALVKYTGSVSLSTLHRCNEYKCFYV